MSRNSKNARLHREAKARKGQTGPAKTTPKHGKQTRTPANKPGALRPAGWAKEHLG